MFAGRLLFKCLDGVMIVACANDRQFKGLCKVANLEKLVENPKFQTNSARVINRIELSDLLTEVFITKTAAQWQELFTSVGVPSGPINDYAKTMEHAQVKYQNLYIEMEDSSGLKVPGIANPLNLSKTDTGQKNYQAPPTLGQHTLEILAETLNFKEDEINSLIEKSVVQGICPKN